jgi:hypothetical protein
MALLLRFREISVSVENECLLISRIDFVSQLISSASLCRVELVTPAWKAMVGKDLRFRFNHVFAASLREAIHELGRFGMFEEHARIVFDSGEKHRATAQAWLASQK